MKKNVLFLFPLLVLLFFPKALAYNEVCPTNAPCCVPPKSIVDGGGCPSGQYWIGNPLTGSCQAPTACVAGSKFQCATNTCDASGNACSTTAVETTICCADGQVAIRDDASVTGWSCGNPGGTSPWSSDAFGPYVLDKTVGIGQNTAAGSYSLNAKADGNNAATAGAIMATSTLASGVGIDASGTRAGGIFTGIGGGAALQALSETAIQVLSNATQLAGTAVGFFQALGGAINEIRIGSSSNHDVVLMRNTIPYLDLVDTGIRQYANFPTGTEASPTSINSGYVIVGDPAGIHLAMDGDEIQAKANSTTTSTLRLNVGSTGDVEINLAHNAFATSICRSAELIGTCTSLLKYKKEIHDLTLGLKQVLQLRPVEFKWKDETVLSGRTDLGFIAEEAAEVNSIFGEYDKDGNLTGVRYAQLTSLLTKAVQELYALLQDQQKQLDAQNAQIRQQQEQIDELKILVCLDHPEAELCN